MKSLLGLIILAFFATPITAFSQYEFRTIDGFGNSAQNPEQGAAHSEILSLCRVGFEDGLSEPKGASLPNPRTVSNEIFNQLTPKPSEQNLNDLWWAFGQFIDHDIVLSENSHTEFMGIAIPSGDPVFDPNGTGSAMIPMMRSEGIADTAGIRRYVNSITAFIDGSNVYGSDIARTNYLRSFRNGKLKVNSGGLPPFNTLNGEFAAPIDPDAPSMDNSSGGASKFLICGDVRANENSLLASVHTLWLREHNRLCDSLVLTYPSYSDEDLFQHARMLVGAQLQRIAFDEWLPAIGAELEPYTGYNESIHPGISNEFAAAGFRFGHTLVGSELKLVDATGIELPSSPLALSEVFFDPISVLQRDGVEALLRGASINHQQELDCGVITDLRNLLFGAPGSGGMDLASLNINRGRDRGLASFNEIRIDMGLQPYDSFTELTAENEISDRLSSLYPTINDLDPWVGFLSEKKTDGLGPTLRLILLEQFSRLRDGDRLYYEGDDAGFSAMEIEWVKRQRLADVIRRNAGGLAVTNSFEVEELIVSSIAAVNQVSAVKILKDQDAVLISGLDSDEPVVLTLLNQLGQQLSTFKGRADGFGESRMTYNSGRIESIVCVVQRQDGTTISKQLISL